MIMDAIDWYMALEYEQKIDFCCMAFIIPMLVHITIKVFGLSKLLKTKPTKQEA